MDLKYTIQSGDTLSQIAQNMGVNMDELAEANDIKDANNIQAGLRLSIPSPPREAEKVRAIQEQVYRDQGQGVKKEAVVQEKEYALPQQIKRDERRDAAVGYTVTSGDTFNAIAKARGVSVERLRALNPDVKDPNKISVGQNLRYQEDDENTEKPSLLAGPSPETVSEQGSSFSTVPENAKAYGKFLLGTVLGVGGEDPDIDVAGFGEEQKKVLKTAMENASKAGRSYIKYTDYPKMKGGETVNNFYRQKRESNGLYELAKASFTDPVFEMFTTVGVFSFNKEGERYTILPDKYDFDKNKNKGGVDNRAPPRDMYARLTHLGQNISGENPDFSFNIYGVI